MKYICISGSRNPEGQTARAMKAAVEGIESTGGSVETHYLPAMKIERCRQCDAAGWGDCRAKGNCVIEDDLAMLVDGIRDADGVIFATPVYFGDLSESLRAFLDRVRRIGRNEDGKKGLEGTPALGICVAGGGGGGAPFCCFSLDKVLRTIGFDLYDTVPVRRQNLEAKIPALKLIGKAFAEK